MFRAEQLVRRAAGLACSAGLLLSSLSCEQQLDTSQATLLVEQFRGRVESHEYQEILSLGTERFRNFGVHSTANTIERVRDRTAQCGPPTLTHNEATESPANLAIEVRYQSECQDNIIATEIFNIHVSHAEMKVDRYRVIFNGWLIADIPEYDPPVLPPMPGIPTH